MLCVYIYVCVCWGVSALSHSSWLLTRKDIVCDSSGSARVWVGENSFICQIQATSSESIYEPCLCICTCFIFGWPSPNVYACSYAHVSVTPYSMLVLVETMGGFCKVVLCVHLWFLFFIINVETITLLSQTVAQAQRHGMSAAWVIQSSEKVWRHSRGSWGRWGPETGEKKKINVSF